MEAGLWGHALFLASHLNPQLYQTVCKRFAQSSISEGSPLQTLYLLLAKCPQGNTFLHRNIRIEYFLYIYIFLYMSVFYMVSHIHISPCVYLWPYARQKC
jgi:hypothetical protein